MSIVSKTQDLITKHQQQMLMAKAQSQYDANKGQIDQRYKDITDFASPFYQQYRKYLQSSMSGIGANALLAPLMAGNVDYATAQKLGSQRGQEMQGQRNEAINKGVMGFGLEMQGQANPLLDMQSNNMFNMLNYGENMRQFDEQMKQRRAEQSDMMNPMNQLLGLGGGLLGMYGFGGGNQEPYNPYSGRGTKY